MEKPSTVRQVFSSHISEALDHAPSVVILDDLDNLVASSSDLDGSQPSSSSTALIEFIADILDEYEARLSCYPILFFFFFMNLFVLDNQMKVQEDIR